MRVRVRLKVRLRLRLRVVRVRLRGAEAEAEVEGEGEGEAGQLRGGNVQEGRPVVMVKWLSGRTTGSRPVPHRGVGVAGPGEG